MTTIEGGMICTNNKIYEMARMIRSHGMIREAGNKTFENKIIKKNKDLSQNLFFYTKVIT